MYARGIWRGRKEGSLRVPSLTLSTLAVGFLLSPSVTRRMVTRLNRGFWLFSYRVHTSLPPSCRFGGYELELCEDGSCIPTKDLGSNIVIIIIMIINNNTTTTSILQGSGHWGKKAWSSSVGLRRLDEVKTQSRRIAWSFGITPVSFGKTTLARVKVPREVPGQSLQEAPTHSTSLSTILRTIPDSGE
ncbi:uncharacterized protein BO66DRAFT_425885 [Aspergillus aculeatinus CBS 121060]|uniref:Uncharacterized protein n=1 Tax=Aspergillus aculeatinus CBS 121060 TaxID=1448322 RepID=A0ACD1HLR0_9EURO|nr:hypothetical protein BO66DRAFT_425885 [Aspergillus aculeatinus CBS 121060]RAH74374.1 hypothetical protein BO66DRAFT_425885 [Aspergillus aculeatinus CBS 121060]